MGLDLATDAGQMLLRLAGPYSWNDTWLEDTATAGLATASAALDAAFDQHGAPTNAILVTELDHLGIPSPTAIDFIATRPGLRRFGDTWVRWGSSIADKTEAALHLSGAPATPALAAAIADGLTERSVRDALWDDLRFTRATKTTWALRSWGIAEYTGVFAEIAARIDTAGGPVSTKAIVDDILAAIPDVAETSIRTYLSAPGFVIDNGMVRRRIEADGWPAVAALSTARGAFHRGRHEIRVALPVTSDVLRGSGQTVNPAVATALGVHPGQRRSFSGPRVEVSLFWGLSATNGAKLSSLRGVATTLGAQRDDTIVLAFNLPDATVEATRISADADARQRLKLLLGKAVRNPVTALARSLGCKPEDVAALLSRRGDEDLLALLDGPSS